MRGTLDNKRVTCFITAGRHFATRSEDAGGNHLEPSLRTFFSNLGIKDITAGAVDGTVEVKQGRIERAS
jgi:FMN-dependent NADH-azoreductase